MSYKEGRAKTNAEDVPFIVNQPEHRMAEQPEKTLVTPTENDKPIVILLEIRVRACCLPLTPAMIPESISP